MDKKGGVGGVSRITVQNVLSHSAEKKSFRNRSVFHLISGTEIFYAYEGYVKIFCWNFFVSQCRKKCTGIFKSFADFD